MRKIFLLLVLLLSFCPCFSAIISFGVNEFAFDGDDLSFKWYANRLSFKYHGLEYGQIDKSGLLRTLDKPHRYSILEPRAEVFNKEGGKPGLVYSIHGISLFYARGERSGFGLEYEKKGLSLFASCFGKDKKENILVQHSPMHRKDKIVFYSGIRYSHDCFSLGAIASVDQYGSVSSIADFSISFSGVDFSIKQGDLIALYSSKKRIRESIEGRVVRDNVYMRWRAFWGEEAIYSYDYRQSEYEKECRISFDEFYLESRASTEFTSKGVLKIDWAYALGIYCFELAYKTKDGIVIAFFKDGNKLSISKDALEVVLTKVFGDNGYSIKLSVEDKRMISFFVKAYI